jgi:hypothetical protein
MLLMNTHTSIKRAETGFVRTLHNSPAPFHIRVWQMLCHRVVLFKDTDDQDVHVYTVAPGERHGRMAMHKRTIPTLSQADE